MKRIPLLLTISLLALCTNAQLLWKVTGNGIENPSYLFGTYHLVSGEFIDSVAGLNDAIKNVDEVWVEILSEKMKTQEAMTMIGQNSLCPLDSTIDKLVTPEEYAIIDNNIKKYMGDFGIGIDQLKRIKPAAIMTQIQAIQASNLLKNVNANNLLDGAVEARVKANNKPAYSFETVQFQVQTLFGYPLKDQAKDLVDMCEKDSLVQETMVNLTNAYLGQNLAEVEKYSTLEEGDDPATLDRLIYSRNRRWVEIITPIMAMQCKGLLVAVGAGHLPGDKGLINLLRKEGFTVEPVK